LRSAKSVTFDHTSIEEFNELNNILNDLIARASKEYTALKEFSENASHELQTPLAIIKSKLDLLIQKENLDEEQQQSVESIYQNINKLTQLNKALLLLSQIESSGYFETKEMDFAEELRREINTFSTIAEFKNISLNLSLIQRFPLKANPVLINILIKNILSNAIKHNNTQAIVNISLKDRMFSVENSGPKPVRETRTLFDRFQKESLSADSVGLGLSIVKEICNLYHFDISYRYEQGFHTITVIMTASA
jgi:signal transduction histidine kinase